MILIIGGAFQGKVQFAKEQYNLTDNEIVQCNENTIIDKNIYQDKAELVNVKAVSELNEWIKTMMNLHPEDYKELIPKKLGEFIDSNSDMVVIMNEVGMGIVPMDRKDRDYREAVGAAGCYLANRATRVIRVVCGYGQVIK